MNSRNHCNNIASRFFIIFSYLKVSIFFIYYSPLYFQIFGSFVSYFSNFYDCVGVVFREYKILFFILAKRHLRQELEADEIMLQQRE